jgi:hypothetical protein
MWDPTYVPHPGPPVSRLWDDDDIAAFTGFRSIDELIARHPDFPAPVPFQMHGRRWRPADIVRWVDALCEDPSAGAAAPAVSSTKRLPLKPLPPIPDFDITTVPELCHPAEGKDRARG